MEYCIQSFNRGSPARKAAKGTILAAILFQYCQRDRQPDQVKANKILTAITHKKFLYILKSYVKVFAKDRSSEQFKNLKQFIDDFGMDIERLK